MKSPLKEDRLLPQAVFGFLAETLRDVARRIEGVEAHAAGAIGPRSLHDSARMMALQDLDLIRQMAEDAARIAEAARQDESGLRSDLAAQLRLSMLRDRLPGAEARDTSDPARAGPDVGGGVELFSAER